jgi:hypothetical protein
MKEDDIRQRIGERNARLTASRRRILLLRIGSVACLCAIAIGSKQAVALNQGTNSSGQAATVPLHPPTQAPGGLNLTHQQALAESGLENPWDVRKIVADLLNGSEQLQPLLRNLNPQQWYDKKGAPSTYIIQWQTAQRQLNDVKYATAQLQQKTESLSLALDLYFRLEALETTTRSLAEGAQRYADRSSADKLNALIAGNFNSRERLRDYLRDLTTSMEQTFKIADEEAQSCRAAMSKQAASKRSRKQ